MWTIVLGLGLGLHTIGSLRGGTVPLLHCQGRLAVGEELFRGQGWFKFSLVPAQGSPVVWGNAPDADADGQPDNAVELSVHRGLYSVMLGDPLLMHMAALPPEVFTLSGLYLRVWFNDGERGFQQLLPDQQLGAVGYAMMAGAVPDGSITVAKLAPGSFDVLASQVAALTAQLNVLSNRHETLVRSLASRPLGVPQVSPNPQDPDLSALGMVRFMTVPGAGWVPGSSQGAPLPRTGHTAVWTGQECLVWGGTLVGGAISGMGAGYDPVQDQCGQCRSCLRPPPDRGTPPFGPVKACWCGAGSVASSWAPEASMIRRGTPGNPSPTPEHPTNAKGMWQYGQGPGWWCGAGGPRRHRWERVPRTMWRTTNGHRCRPWAHRQLGRGISPSGRDWRCSCSGDRRRQA